MVYGSSGLQYTAGVAPPEQLTGGIQPHKDAPDYPGRLFHPDFLDVSQIHLQAETAPHAPVMGPAQDERSWQEQVRRILRRLKYSKQT